MKQLIVEVSGDLTAGHVVAFGVNTLGHSAGDITVYNEDSLRLIVIMTEDGEGLAGALRSLQPCLKAGGS